LKQKDANKNCQKCTAILVFINNGQKDICNNKHIYLNILQTPNSQFFSSPDGANMFLHSGT